MQSNHSLNYCFTGMPNHDQIRERSQDAASSFTLANAMPQVMSESLTSATLQLAGTPAVRLNTLLDQKVRPLHAA